MRTFKNTLLLFAAAMLTIHLYSQSTKREFFYDVNKTKLNEIYYVSKVPPYPKMGLYRKYSPEGTLIKECSYKDGKLTGVYKEMYDNGEPMIQTAYMENVQTGKTTQYFKDGSVQLETFFKGGVMNGRTTEYYENHQKKLEATFLNGKENGVTKLYYEDGILESESEKLNGDFNGVTKHYYPTGRLKYEANAKMGLKDGMYKAYYENGQLSDVGMFANDRQNGDFSNYASDGHLIGTAHIVNDQRDGIQTIYTTNKAITITNTWTQDRLTGKGTVRFSKEVLNDQNTPYADEFYGTEYGLESDWVELGESTFETKVRYSDRVEKTFPLKVQAMVRKRILEPNSIYVVFRVDATVSATAFYKFFNLTFTEGDKTVFDDYYNFATSKYGKRYPANFLSDIICSKPKFTFSIAVENPNPEHDILPGMSNAEKVLQGREVYNQPMTWARERQMNIENRAPSAPNQIEMQPDCKGINHLKELIKLASLN